jgi:hypothetical protein
MHYVLVFWAVILMTNRWIETEIGKGHGRGYRNLKRDHVCRPEVQGEPSVWNFRYSARSIVKVTLMTNATQQNHRPTTTYRLPHKTAPSLSNFAAPCTKTDDGYKAQTCVNMYRRRPSQRSTASSKQSIIYVSLTPLQNLIIRYKIIKTNNVDTQ